MIPWRASAVAASVLLLAGCASLFPPDPTTTPDAASPSPAPPVACTTLNSTVSASDPSATGAGQFVVVESRVALFDEHSENVQESGTAIDGSGVVGVSPYDAFDTFVGDRADWNTNVIDSIHTLGTLPANLGIVPGAVQVVNDKPFARSGAGGQTWVRGWVARSEVVPFQVNCPSGSAVLGTLTTFDPATGVQLEFRCDSREHPRDSAAQAALRAECDRLR